MRGTRTWIHIGNPERILADLYEPDILRVRASPNISDSVDKETRAVKVRAVVPNRGRVLKAEMFVKVAIGTASASVLTIPQSAIHRASGQAFVLVETGKDRYARLRVKLGAELDGWVEVLDGVTPADVVVSSRSLLPKRTAK